MPLFSWGQGDQNGTYPATSEAAEEMWEGMTPRLEEFLQWIDYDGDGQLVSLYFLRSSLQYVQKNIHLFLFVPICRYPSNLTRQDSGACLHVEEYASMSYGRCYVLLFSCPFQARKTVYLNLDLAALERTRLVLYFHHPRARSGLSHELWPAPVAQGAVEGGGWGSFELSKHIRWVFKTEVFNCSSLYQRLSTTAASSSHLRRRKSSLTVWTRALRWTWRILPDRTESATSQSSPGCCPQRRGWQRSCPTAQMSLSTRKILSPSTGFWRTMPFQGAS